MNKDRTALKPRRERTYRPLSSVQAKPLCPKCKRQMKAHDQLQEHLDGVHPGWVDDVVKGLGITER